LSTMFGRYSARKVEAIAGSTPILVAIALTCSEPSARIVKTAHLVNGLLRSSPS
jgi:hypothetical protein